MRIQTLLVALGLAALAAGCQKGSGGYTGGAWGTGKGKGKTPPAAVRSMPANAEQIKEAIGGYFARTENRVSDPTFLAISEPIKVKQNQGTALAYWVQYTATNAYGDLQMGQHELFVLKDGQVMIYARTGDEVREKMGERWANEHRPPPWPDVLPTDAGKK